MDRFLPFRCGRSYFCYRAPGHRHATTLRDTGSALAADRHQAQPRGQSDIGEHFQRSTLVMRQAFRYPDEHADHTVAASRSARRAIVTVDYHRRPRPGAVPPLVSGPLRAMGSFLSAWLMRSSER